MTKQEAYYTVKLSRQSSVTGSSKTEAMTPKPEKQTVKFAESKVKSEEKAGAAAKVCSGHFGKQLSAVRKDVRRPFCGALNRVTWGRTDEFALFHWSGEAIIAIQCWRAMLCLVRFRETELTRSMESFAPATPVLVAEFDSSLCGAGLIWFVRTNGSEVVRGVDLSFLEFGVDSSIQNLAEYIGAILAVVGQVMLGFLGTSIALWTRTERPRGVRVTNASTPLCIAAGVEVKEVTHIAREDSGKCDRLSRRWDLGKTPTMSVTEEAEEMGLGAANVLEMGAVPSVRGMIEHCDPRTDLNSESQFITFWLQARRAIDSFVSMYTHEAASIHDIKGEHL